MRSSSLEKLCVMLDVILDESGDEEVTVVIVLETKRSGVKSCDAPRLLHSYNVC